MSDITYIFLQMLVLLCYGSWIAYRQKGSRLSEGQSDDIA
jgi:hypothetical protein